MIKINVYDITGSRAVTDSPQGENVFQKICEGFEKGEKVELDFCNVKTILSMFLNSAVAPLYSRYSSDFLNQHLSIKNMDPEDKDVLKRVNERAKQFYSEKNSNMELSRSEIYGDD